MTFKFPSESVQNKIIKYTKSTPVKQSAHEIILKATDVLDNSYYYHLFSYTKYMSQIQSFKKKHEI